MDLFKEFQVFYAKSVLFYSKVKEKLGLTVPKVGFMEVKTQNAEQLNDLVTKFFSAEKWDNKKDQLEVIPEAFATHLYISKRKFFSTSDSQIAYVLLKKEPTFIGIMLRVNIPNQSFYNLFKNLNNKLILEFKDYIGQYYQIDNFYIEFDFV